MNTSRIWALGTGVAIVGIVAAAVGLGVQPQLAAASAADSSTKQVQTQNATTQIELAGLSRLAATQSTLEATNGKLGSAVTGSLRLSTFSRQLRNAAALDGVTLVSLSPSTAITYAAAPAAADSTSTTTTTSTKSGAAPGDFGRTSPLITAANFTLIPVTVTVTGDEAASMQFASDAQHLNRLFAVDTVGYTAASTDGTVSTTTISGTIYALKH